MKALRVIAGIGVFVAILGAAFAIDAALLPVTLPYDLYQVFGR